MEFKKDDYILGIWFASKPEVDWQLTVIKRDGLWKGEYRFRYHVDHKIFDSKDRKSWYTMDLKGDSDENVIIEKMNFVLALMVDKMGFNFHEFLEVRGNFEKFMFRGAQCDWMHMKKMSVDEAKEQGYV